MRKYVPVAGRMAGRRDAGLAPSAGGVDGSFDRPVRSLGSAAPLFVTRVAGHRPVPLGLAPHVGARPRAEVPEVAPTEPARPQLVVARHAAPVLPFPREPALNDASSLRWRHMPAAPATEFIAPAAYQSLPVRRRTDAFARWRPWLQFSTRGRGPREVGWAGWRASVDPTMVASFGLIAAAAVFIGLNSFSSGGMYNLVTPSPSQTNGRPPDSPALTKAPDVRAIRQAPGVQRPPGSNGPTVPQTYASWPAPSTPALGSTLVASHPGLPSAGVPGVPATSAPVGGGGGGPAPTPIPSDTPAPSPTDTTPPTASDTPVPSPSETTTATAGP
ncbi:MAG: hypothetical protein QOF95_1194 [Pseudonocardiales bacterium]|nr:hypothetical protein [Pseudonocardiales bacterium]